MENIFTSVREITDKRIEENAQIIVERISKLLVEAAEECKEKRCFTFEDKVTKTVIARVIEILEENGLVVEKKQLTGLFKTIIISWKR